MAGRFRGLAQVLASLKKREERKEKGFKESVSGEGSPRKKGKKTVGTSSELLFWVGFIALKTKKKEE